MTLLKVMDNLNHRIESLNSVDPPTDHDDNPILPAEIKHREVNTGNQKVDVLGLQLKDIENVDKHLKDSLEEIEWHMGRVVGGWKETMVCFLYRFVA
jgi:hypothetical protein